MRGGPSVREGEAAGLAGVAGGEGEAEEGVGFVLDAVGGVLGVLVWWEGG